VLAAALILLLPQAADASVRSCTVDVVPVAFGTFSGSRVNSTGRVTLTFTGSGANNAYTVALSQGGSNTFLDRFMFNGLNELHYNLYIDPTRILIWGNGAGQTRLQTGSFDFHGPDPVVVPLIVYGQVPDQPTPAAGAYSDLITVTVTF
jgi:spore coat protein U-like protein